MSYKDFSNLNAATSAAVLDPRTNVLKRIFDEDESLVSMAKDIPTSWGRSYSSVMILKYDQNGNPSDVTDTTVPNAPSVPNSLISDLKRRFNNLFLQRRNDQSACGSPESQETISMNNFLQGLDQTTSDSTTILACVSLPTGYLIWEISLGTWRIRYSDDAEDIDPSRVIGDWVSYADPIDQTKYTIYCHAFIRTGGRYPFFMKVDIDTSSNGQIIATMYRGRIGTPVPSSDVASRTNATLFSTFIGHTPLVLNAKTISMQAGFGYGNGKIGNLYPHLAGLNDEIIDGIKTAIDAL